MNRKASTLYPTFKRLVIINNQQFEWQRGYLPSHLFMGWEVFYTFGKNKLYYQFQNEKSSHAQVN